MTPSQPAPKVLPWMREALWPARQRLDAVIDGLAETADNTESEDAETMARTTINQLIPVARALHDLTAVPAPPAAEAEAVAAEIVAVIPSTLLMARLRKQVEAQAVASIARLRSLPRAPSAIPCAVCGAPAACVGAYEGRTETEYACDECCGHGNEDGWCEPLPLLAAQRAEKEGK